MFVIGSEVIEIGGIHVCYTVACSEAGCLTVQLS